MKRAHRMHRMGALAVGAAVTIGSLFGAQAAFAATGESGATETRDAIELAWADGAPVSASESFFGMPVAVPGDRAERTIKVKNVGPEAAILRADIRDVSLLLPGAPDVHHNATHAAPDQSGSYEGAGDQGNFYDDVSVVWNGGQASFTELAAAGTTDIAEVAIERGETVTLTLAYDFPADSVSGNGANVAPREASFDVFFTMSGDTNGPGPDPKAPDTGTPGKKGGLANTGGTELGLLLGGAGLLVAAGGYLVVTRRKRTAA